MKSVNTSLQHHLFPNINEDGWKFISILAIITIITAMLWIPLGCISLIITIWCFYSFRDPIRVIPLLSSAIVAPADGYIVSITKEKGPDSLGLQRKNFTKISILSSIFDSNINRMPIKGKINKTFYDKGKSFSGSFNKKDINNERNLMVLKHGDGVDLVIEQTATFCNKRIINKAKNGDEFITGQRFGFIRFGGYTDIFLPEKIEPQVCVGQKMIAGETVLADINSDSPRIEGEIR